MESLILPLYDGVRYLPVSRPLTLTGTYLSYFFVSCTTLTLYGDSRKNDNSKLVRKGKRSRPVKDDEKK